MGEEDGFPAGFQGANSLDLGSALPGRADIREAFTDRRIRAAIALIKAGLAKDTSVSAVASRLGLSRWRFEHLFKAQTGVTFRNAVRTIRLDSARKLLADPLLSIKEIAARCGYASTSNLSREFKREFGLPPSVYRRSTSG